MQINAEKTKDIALAAGVVIAVYMVYKLVKGLSEGKDALGYGESREKAEKRDKKVANMKPQDNPFNPSFALSRLNSGKEVLLLTDKASTDIYNTVTQKLGLLETYKHPLSYLENREKVNEYLLRNLKTQSQVSSLAEKFRKNGKDLYTVLKEGYREQGWTGGGKSAGKVQRLFTDLVDKLLSLPEISK